MLGKFLLTVWLAWIPVGHTSGITIHALLSSAGNVFPVLAVQTESIPTEKQGTNAQESTSVDTSEELTPAEKERRKNFVTISWIMLTGVGILGGLLLSIVLVLGASVRRRTRTPLPNAPQRNPFWYFRPDRKNRRPEPPESSESEPIS